MQEKGPKYRPDSDFRRLDSLKPGEYGLLYPLSGKSQLLVTVEEIRETRQRGNPAVKTTQGHFSGGTAVVKPRWWITLEE